MGSMLSFEEDYYDVEIEATGNYSAESLIHHNTGKSYTGSQFAIEHLCKRPELTGFIGANSYDQMTQASLREMFSWLDFYRIPYVYNCQPPKGWNVEKRFPSYQNILSCKVGHKVAHAFTRVLSDSNALRGIQFSWYWLDETRDTPRDTHDVVLSRMRESNYRKGLITSTTNGEDWAYQRFGRAKPGQMLYGSMHIRTQQSVDAGIITPEFYHSLTQSYSELMIAQELDALHVNINGGRAYYAFDQRNARNRAPWGSQYPDPRMPLIVGCDFNFDPSPHIWIVGQQSPDKSKIHWFKEISGNRKSTVEMAQVLASQFGNFFIRVFGDRSGARATTSNAGKPDYDQIGEVLSQADISYSIDTDQGSNPLVRNRVENMNRLAKNGAGEITMTYDPQGCPFFDADQKAVGWKQNSMKGQGKLDSGGNKDLTHASDAAGYAAWKLYPPSKRGVIQESVPSLASTLVGEYQRL
jgi:hypothetical protein